MGNLCISGTLKKSDRTQSWRLQSTTQAPSALELRLIDAVKVYGEARRQKALANKSNLNRYVLQFPSVREGFESLRSSFGKFDTNADGALDYSEFKNACRELNWSISQQTLEDIFLEADMDHSKSIDFKEFVIIVSCVLLLSSNTEALENSKLRQAIDIVVDTFMLFDGDGTGYIALEEVNKKMSEGGLGKETSSSNTLRFEEMDWDQNGKVSFIEFLFAMEGWVDLDIQE
mmetsp:Transcript_934/g.3018  ORF Transcript_934/g.3018 Transcript_934/m.3018 type:complete len:231 (+) Transcript_934:72-764(+)